MRRRIGRNGCGRLFPIISSQVWAARPILFVRLYGIEFPGQSAVRSAPSLCSTRQRWVMCRAFVFGQVTAELDSVADKSFPVPFYPSGWWRKNRKFAIDKQMDNQTVFVARRKRSIFMSRISNELLEPLYSVTRSDWQPFFIIVNSMAHSAQFLIIVSYHIINSFLPPSCASLLTRAVGVCMRYRTGLSRLCCMPSMCRYPSYNCLPTMVMSAKAFGPLPMAKISFTYCVSFLVFNQIAVFC